MCGVFAGGVYGVYGGTGMTLRGQRGAQAMVDADNRMPWPSPAEVDAARQVLARDKLHRQQVAEDQYAERRAEHDRVRAAMMERYGRVRFDDHPYNSSALYWELTAERGAYRKLALEE
jgi:hypothetical protein